MKVRKTVKSIIALGTGLTMLGATVFGAMAVDLGAYPSQYIKDGKFDGLMVIGSNAKTEDVLGVVDIATSLQFASKVEKTGTAGTATLSGDAYQIGSQADMLELNEFIGKVKGTIGSDEMSALATTKIRTTKGTTDADQYLKFNSTAGLKVVYDKWSKKNLVGDYLWSNNGDTLFTYELQFPAGLKSGVYDGASSNTKVTNQSSTGYLNDITDEDLLVIGDTFNVVEAVVTTNSKLVVTLMGGALTDTLKEGDSKTYEINGKSYEVNVLIIGDTSGTSVHKVKLMINGQVTKNLADGDTDTLDDGTVIGIKSVLAAAGNNDKGTNIVSFYIGANKVELTDANYSDSSFDTTAPKIDEVSVSDGSVKWQGSWASATDDFKITTLAYKLKSQAKVSGDLFIEKGGSLRTALKKPEGMLSKVWDVKYLGLTEPATIDVKVTPSGDNSYNLDFTNLEGIEYSVPLIDNSNDKSLGYKLGSDDNKLAFVESGTDTYAGALLDIDDYFIVSKDGNDKSNTHVLTFDSVDTTDGILSFTDIGDGSTKEVTFTTGLDFTSCNATKSDLIVGGSSYTVHVCNSGATATNTQYRVNIDLDGGSDVAGNDPVNITVAGGALLSFRNTLTYNATSNVTTPNPSDQFNRSGSFNPGGFGYLNMSVIVLAKYTDSNVQQEFNFSVWNTTSNKVDLDYFATTGAANISRNSDKNSDYKKGMSVYGIYVEEYTPSDSTSADSLTISVPSEQVFAQVFVTGGTNVAGGASIKKTASTVAEYSKIEVGAAVLDSEITDIAAQNLIIVGGPCANTVAATVLGIPSTSPECFQNFPVKEGQGIIKMVANGDKVATVVAGYSAADTRKAAQVLANYDSYADQLAGKSDVVVSGSQIVTAEVKAETTAAAEETPEETTAAPTTQ